MKRKVTGCPCKKAFFDSLNQPLHRIAARAAHFDRIYTFPKENMVALQQSGYLVATIPLSL
jgi:hypothetical protein